MPVIWCKVCTIFHCLNTGIVSSYPTCRMDAWLHSFFCICVCVCVCVCVLSFVGGSPAACQSHGSVCYQMCTQNTFINLGSGSSWATLAFRAFLIGRCLKWNARSFLEKKSMLCEVWGFLSLFFFCEQVSAVALLNPIPNNFTIFIIPEHCDCNSTTFCEFVHWDMCSNCPRVFW